MSLYGVQSRTIRRLQTTPPPEFSTRIIGGQDADRYRYPYAQVSLQDDLGHSCGGSVVAPDVIMTAAHCAEAFNTVVVGLYNLSDVSGKVQSFAIDERNKHVHSQYNPYTNENDVMLIQLDSNITVVDPIRVNNNVSVPIATDTLAVVGWGATDVTIDEIEYPKIFMEVELFYVPNLFCKRIVGEDGETLGSSLLEDMMCATDEGKDSCYGDSGGPLILLGSSPADDVQVGVVSWGTVCGGKVPGVYHRLSHSYGWVKKNVCSLSSAPPDWFNCFGPPPTTPPEPTNAPTNPPTDPPPSNATNPNAIASAIPSTREQSMAAETRLGWTFAISFFLSMLL